MPTQPVKLTSSAHCIIVYIYALLWCHGNNTSQKQHLFIGSDPQLSCNTSMSQGSQEHFEIHPFPPTHLLFLETFSTSSFVLVNIKALAAAVSLLVNSSICWLGIHFWSHHNLSGPFLSNCSLMQNDKQASNVGNLTPYPHYQVAPGTGPVTLPIN